MLRNLDGWWKMKVMLHEDIPDSPSIRKVVRRGYRIFRRRNQWTREEVRAIMIRAVYIESEFRV